MVFPIHLSLHVAYALNESFSVKNSFLHDSQNWEKHYLASHLVVIFVANQLMNVIVEMLVDLLGFVKLSAYTSALNYNEQRPIQTFKHFGFDFGINDFTQNYCIFPPVQLWYVAQNDKIENIFTYLSLWRNYENISTTTHEIDSERKTFIGHSAGLMRMVSRFCWEWEIFFEFVNVEKWILLFFVIKISQFQFYFIDFKRNDIQPHSCSFKRTSVFYSLPWKFRSCALLPNICAHFLFNANWYNQFGITLCNFIWNIVVR